MSVKLIPGSNEIVVHDTLKLDGLAFPSEFTLNSGLKITSSSAALSEIGHTRSSKTYRVDEELDNNALTISYSGKPEFIKPDNPHSMPQGIIDKSGVYLDGSSAWYPRFNANVHKMDMTVELPAGWQSISIGKQTIKDGHAHWHTQVPHDDIYLLAGNYHVYDRTHRGIDLSVVLLSKDDALAERYLDLLDDYIDMYSAIFGEYPFAKFSVVENQWQTGFGMPSFTLLGSRVIRLPFIPYTSLPHEILHNWLGNGIWIDYSKGNWSEGLTAYLSDHLLKEFSNQGSQYRLQALQRYANYAANNGDSPLVNFTHRHSDASQSIGYSKSLMLFHMLRREMGDQAFLVALRRLWEQHRYQAIGFQQALETLGSGQPELVQRFEHWLTSTGAPSLIVDDIELTGRDGDYRLKLDISQHGPEVFEFTLPVMLTFEQGSPAVYHHVQMNKARHSFVLTLAQKPQRVDIDPTYDVMRYLDASEQPPALSQLFGGKTWLVLPSDAPEDQLNSWLTLARQWQERYPAWRVITDHESALIPDKSPVMILGYDNGLLDNYGDRLARSLSKPADRASTSLVTVDNNDDGHILGFIGSQDPEMIIQLARKLPHYGSYGLLVFDNQTARPMERKKLRSQHSMLSFQLGSQPISLVLPQERPLINVQIGVQ